MLEAMTRYRCARRQGRRAVRIIPPTHQHLARPVSQSVADQVAGAPARFVTALGRLTSVIRAAVLRRAARRGDRVARRDIIEPLEGRVLLTALYWDPQGAAGLGGSGTWDTSAAAWSTSPNGGGKLRAWADGDTAIFSGAPGIVMLSRDVLAGGVKIVSAGYTIAGGHTLSLKGAGTISNDLFLQKANLKILSHAALTWSGGNLTFSSGSSFANHGTFNITGGGSAVLADGRASFKNSGRINWLYKSQLAGDGVTDDAPAIQNLIDLAYTFGMKNVVLPAGTFRLGSAPHLYGQNVTLSGQGAATVLAVDHHYTGDPSATGMGITVQPILDTTLQMAAAPVAGNTIVLAGASSGYAAGDSLLLNNGRGSVNQINIALGGQPEDFNELAPCEIVHVKSVAVEGGNTVITLSKNIVGTGDYQNISPNGAPNDHYVNVSKILAPADHVTIKNLSMHFSDTLADAAIGAHYTTNLTIQNIKLLDGPAQDVAGGDIWIVGSDHALVTGVTGPSAGIALNSSRFCTIAENNVLQIALEEAATDNLITHNTLCNAGTFAIRINDPASARDRIIGNTMTEGAFGTGTIAIAGASDVTIANNIIKQTTSDGAGDMIWLGTVNGATVTRNTAAQFVNYATDPSLIAPLNIANNSWQS